MVSLYVARVYGYKGGEFTLTPYYQTTYVKIILCRKKVDGWMKLVIMDPEKENRDNETTLSNVKNYLLEQHNGRNV